MKRLFDLKDAGKLDKGVLDLAARIDYSVDPKLKTQSLLNTRCWLRSRSYTDAGRSLPNMSRSSPTDN